MKKFCLLNNTVEFVDDFKVYAVYYKRFNSIIEIFEKKYNENVRIAENFNDYLKTIREYDDFFPREYDKIAEQVRKMLIDKEIFDVDSEEIISNIKSMENYKKTMDLAVNVSATLMDSLELKLDNLHNESLEKANNSFSDTSFSIWTSSAIDMLVFGLFDASQQAKEMNKAQRVYDNNYYSNANTLINETDIKAIDYSTKISESLYFVSINIIKEMFEYFINQLIKNNIISSDVLNGLDTQGKAQKILKNINDISNNTKRNQQIITALRLNPFMKEIHYLLLEQEDLEIEQYMEFINFIHYLDNIEKHCKTVLLEDYKYNNIKENTILKIYAKLLNTNVIEASYEICDTLVNKLVSESKTDDFLTSIENINKIDKIYNTLNLLDNSIMKKTLIDKSKYYKKIIQYFETAFQVNANIENKEITTEDILNFINVLKDIEDECKEEERIKEEKRNKKILIIKITVSIIIILFIISHCIFASIKEKEKQKERNDLISSFQEDIRAESEKEIKYKYGNINNRIDLKSFTITDIHNNYLYAEITAKPEFDNELLKQALLEDFIDWLDSQKNIGNFIESVDENSKSGKYSKTIVIEVKDNKGKSLYKEDKYID